MVQKDFWFDDAADEASWENEVLSNEGYAFHLYKEHLYFAVVNFYTRERLERKIFIC